VQEATTEAGWRALLAPRLMLTLCVLLGGVLLHSMNVLITATLLPSVVAELGGANLMSWPTTAFVASSIVAASGASLVSGWFGNRRAFSGGAVIYAAGAALCACAPTIGFVIAGRFGFCDRRAVESDGPALSRATTDRRWKRKRSVKGASH